ncbi:hypothetical protein GQ42DRAFT_81460 [Ramicandelaber brevisporus]|nr:hypothetical protein GQ42DRAFT_81460 [Ramicandelaber brevisporus]
MTCKAFLWRLLYVAASAERYRRLISFFKLTVCITPFYVCIYTVLTDIICTLPYFVFTLIM